MLVRLRPLPAIRRCDGCAAPTLQARDDGCCVWLSCCRTVAAEGRVPLPAILAKALCNGQRLDAAPEQHRCAATERKRPAYRTRGCVPAYQRQNPDGGWGWWGGEDSRVFVSSYVVLGLVEAQEAGFAVDPQVIDRGVDYLKQQFQPVEDLEGYQLNQQAFILYVLASAGQGDMGRSVALYDVRERLAHYGRAWLALTFGMLGEQGETTAQERVSVLLDDLTGAAIVSATGAHWEEKTTDWWTMNTNVRSTTPPN